MPEPRFGSDSRVLTDPTSGASSPARKDASAPLRAPRPGVELFRVIEGILFVGTRPLHPEDFGKAFPALTAGEVARSIERLARRYRQERRPYRIRWTNEGYVLELAPRHREELARRSRTERGAKLSRAAIEVLSVVAYQQPITLAAIEKLTGFDPRPVLRQLVRRQLVERAPGEHSTGPDRLYATTPRFLELLGIASLDDLPYSTDLAD